MNFIKKNITAILVGLGLLGGGTMLGFTNPTENPTPVINTNLNNLTYSGMSATFNTGEDVVAGDIVYLKSDGKMWRADANVITTTPAMAMATANIASTTSGTFLLHGYYRNDTLYSFATGSIIYVSTDVGQATTTQPSAANDLIQSIGIGIEEDVIYFNPDLIFLNHS